MKEDAWTRRDWLRTAGLSVAGFAGSCASTNAVQQAGNSKRSAEELKWRPASKSETALSLDADHWLIATDPGNIGHKNGWWKRPRKNAKPTPVPWVIQAIFKGYHGVVWYWRTFRSPPKPEPEGRYLLKFWAVNYLADVWLNDVHVGRHEGSETPFTIDVTQVVLDKGINSLAVRVLSPGNKAIDGITLRQIPHRNQTVHFECGCDYDHGGIEDSVELLVRPAIFIQDCFVQPNLRSGTIEAILTIRNTTRYGSDGVLEVLLSTVSSGESVITKLTRIALKPGDNVLKVVLAVEAPRLWEPSNPFLYRLVAKISSKHSSVRDEYSTRCGFREFKFENGFFRLNDRRIYWKSSVSGNMSPIGIHVPYRREWFRRDLINSKAMGFNAIRFWCGLPTRFQLDLCDEIGLLVYEESFAGQGFEYSPEMSRRFDSSISGMVRRDRNHPSIVIWGLLNETKDGRQFRHAVKSLALVRSLDPRRMVFLNSGRFDRDLKIGSFSNPKSNQWECVLGNEGPDGDPAGLEPLLYPSCKGAGDAHLYPSVPHRADSIKLLRTFASSTKHKRAFLSEYGIATALDLMRIVREYEQRGQGDCGEADFYRKAMCLFLADWNRWKMAACFGRPEDYFKQCIGSMAQQRLLGINAVRANPCLIGYDLTGTVDQGYTGEGLTTAFREIKPQMFDAMFDAFAPLRWCLFVEPVNLYRGGTVQLDAVLVNEDILNPGQYPVTFEVFGPDNKRMFSQHRNVTIGSPQENLATDLAEGVFSEMVTVNWPSGKYRFVATFEQGAAGMGKEAVFYVADRTDMPTVHESVALWGRDAKLSQWLASQKIPFHSCAVEATGKQEVILVGNAIPAPFGRQAFAALDAKIRAGSVVVFISPQVFAWPSGPTTLMYFGKNCTLQHIPAGFYHKDDWAFKHQIFDGLPCGVVMDYTFYREVISDSVWQMNTVPEEVVAGAIYSNTAYASGLTIAVDNVGGGRIILNTMRIRENLGRDPSADRLLLNMLRYAKTLRNHGAD